MVPPGGHGRMIDIDIGRPGRIKANRLRPPAGREMGSHAKN